MIIIGKQNNIISNYFVGNAMPSNALGYTYVSYADYPTALSA